MSNEKVIALSIWECRVMLSEFSKEYGEGVPPEYDWFAAWFEGTPEPNPDCDERLKEMIHANAEAEGLDVSVADHVVKILKIMYFG